MIGLLVAIVFIIIMLSFIYACLVINSDIDDDIMDEELQNFCNQYEEILNDDTKINKEK